MPFTRDMPKDLKMEKSLKRMRTDHTSTKENHGCQKYHPKQVLWQEVHIDKNYSQEDIIPKLYSSSKRTSECQKN